MKCINLRSSSFSCAVILLLLLTNISSFVSADEVDATSYSDSIDSQSTWSEVKVIVNAFDSNNASSAFIEANRCDGGSATCSSGQTFIHYDLVVDLSSNTSRIDVRWKTVDPDGSIPTDSKAVLLLENITSGGWDNVMEDTTIGNVVSVEMIPIFPNHHLTVQNKVTLRISLFHNGSSFASDELAFYLYTIFDVRDDPADDDADGLFNSIDSCPDGETGWISTAITDYDTDGCQDSSEDLDDDNDIVNDTDDNCQKGELGWVSDLINDIDTDGCRDNSEDNDDDGDTIDDGLDNCSTGEVGWISTTVTDHDGDGCRDSSEDDDDDNDGIQDLADDCQTGQTDWASSSVTDYDTDGCQDLSEDDDDDNDGIQDGSDDCEKGTLGWISNATTDLDGDGCQDGTEDDDNDGDSIPNSIDSCPSGDTAWTSNTNTDRDQDGCKDVTEDDNDDGDSLLDESDNCPSGEINWTSTSANDYDNDGCKDSSEDDDDDGDTVEDLSDNCSLGETGWISTILTDFDNDGCQDSSEDLDDDNDSHSDQEEMLCLTDPYNESSIPLNFDGDEECDYLDDDDDNDLVNDTDEPYPAWQFDALRSIDRDGDELDDNNFDDDDDNDGVNDTEDIWPYVSEWQYDFDGDGLADEDTERETDIDNDAVLNIVEDLCGSDNFDNASVPELIDGSWYYNGYPCNTDDDLDNDGWTNQQEDDCLTDRMNPDDFPTDFDNDWLCDLLDDDDDNDGLPDHLDPNDNDKDSDDDNYTDLQEYDCGTNLTDPNDKPFSSDSCLINTGTNNSVPSPDNLVKNLWWILLIISIIAAIIILSTIYVRHKKSERDDAGHIKFEEERTKQKMSEEETKRQKALIDAQLKKEEKLMAEIKSHRRASAKERLTQSKETKAFFLDLVSKRSQSSGEEAEQYVYLAKWVNYAINQKGGKNLQLPQIEKRYRDYFGFLEETSGYMVPLILTIAASYPKKKFNSAAKVKEAEKIFIETARGIFGPISGGKWSIDEKGGWTPTGGELEIEDCMTFQSSVKPSELLKEENLKKIRSLIWEYCAQLQHQCVYFSIHPNYPCDNIDPLGQFDEENPEKKSIKWRERDIQRRGFMTPVTKEEFAYIPFKDLEL